MRGAVGCELPQDDARRTIAKHVREARGYGVDDTLLHGDDGVVIEPPAVGSEANA